MREIKVLDICKGERVYFKKEFLRGVFMNQARYLCNTVRAKVLAALIATVGAVCLPQVFHAVGAAFGVGSAMGEAFLPMHIAVLLVGFFAGPVVGGCVGAVSPLISFAVSGMPRMASLPFMVVELCAYGLIAGLLADKQMPIICKLLLAQLGGRVLRIAVMAVAFFGLSFGASPVAFISSVAVGLPGLLLQWALIPLVIRIVEGNRRG